MKAIVLAGGFGTRMSELTERIPKPMVNLGKYPILLHIMSHYSFFGIRDFLILGGYKVEVIQNYFDSIRPLVQKNNWTVEILDTGLHTSTAGRLFQAREKVKGDFFLTYGDGLSDVDIAKLYVWHRKMSKAATVTAVHPPPRFGYMEVSEFGTVEAFKEKDSSKVGWINGGYFCFSEDIFNYLISHEDSLESSNMEHIVYSRQLSAFRHEGFWMPMDTLREKNRLDELIATGKVPWKTQSLEE